MCYNSREELPLIFSLLLWPCSTLPIRERIGVPVGILVLLAFVAVGIDAIVRPKRYMNSYLRRGGDMLREWNEVQVQLGGLVFTCASGWILYELVRGAWAKCFT